MFKRHVPVQNVRQSLAIVLSVMHFFLGKKGVAITILCAAFSDQPEA